MHLEGFILVLMDLHEVIHRDRRPSIHVDKAYWGPPVSVCAGVVEHTSRRVEPWSAVHATILPSTRDVLMTIGLTRSGSPDCSRGALAVEAWARRHTRAP
jgi:hypothetical protein